MSRTGVTIKAAQHGTCVFAASASCMRLMYFLLIMDKLQNCYQLHTGKPDCIVLMTSVQGEKQQLCILFHYTVNQVLTNRIEKHNNMLKKLLKICLMLLFDLEAN